jgi:hypothetical protein
LGRKSWAVFLGNRLDAIPAGEGKLKYVHIPTYGRYKIDFFNRICYSSATSPSPSASDVKEVATHAVDMRTRRFVHQSSDKPEIQWRSVFRPAADGNKNDADENMRERAAAHNTPVVLSRVDITPELRSQFLSLFIDSFLPDPGDGVDRGNVIHSLPSVLGHSQLLDNAITCLCTVFIGITNRDLCLWHDAMSLYCETLRTMLGSIKNSSKRPTDDILYTAVVLGYYEVSHLLTFSNLYLTDNLS